MNTAQFDKLTASKRYFKIGKAASLLGLSAETLRRWERAGKISFPRTPGGKRLFTETDLDSIKNILNQPQTLPAGPLRRIEASRQEPTQTSSQNARVEQVTTQSTKTYTSKKQIPMGKLVNLFVYLAFFALIMSNLTFNAPDLREKVLGVETAIIPAAQEGGALAQAFLTKAISLLKYNKSLCLSLF